jgi:hypothetical protein
MKQGAVKRIKLDFAGEEPVTSFGGMVVPVRMMVRLGLGSLLKRHLPARGGYGLSEITLAAVAGLLSGAERTVATEVVRHDPALQALLGLNGAPEEATFWRSLESAGSAEALGGFQTVCGKLARRVVKGAAREALFDGKFVQVFVDGTLLEGSGLREGTKTIQDKGEGLLWTVGFVGPLPVAARLAASGEGEGEATHARELIERLDKEVLEPAGIKGDALVLMDSLHGNGPTLDVLEDRGLKYIVGARGLKRAECVLAEQPECQWTATPEYDKAGNVEESAVCTAFVQCAQWETKRVLVGRRWKNKGEMLWNYAGVLTNLHEEDARLGKETGRPGGFARALWRLYDRKGACENHFKNLLTDLGLHRPPCREWRRNAGFYAVGLLAGLVGIACDLLTSEEPGRRRRLSTLRRWLLCVPARIRRHARTAHVQILGLSEWWRTWIAGRFLRAARC